MLKRELDTVFADTIKEKLASFRGIAIKIVNSSADADDAVQNALVKAWDRRLKFCGEPEFLSAWIYRIVINESYEILRKRMKEQKKIDGFEPDVASDEDGNYTLELLDRAILNLPKLYRETVHIAILSELKTSEAAKILECSENTLYQRVHHAKALLKDEIERLMKND